MDLSKFYSQKERLVYNPKTSVSGFKWRNKFVAYDDRFVAVKKNLDNLIKEIGQNKVTLLDIGVGDAVYESILEKDNLKKLEVYGVDISKVQISRAKKYLKKGLILDVDKNKLPFKENSFDLVLVSEILEHLFFPDKVLKEAIRVLKKGGYIILTFPNSGALQLRLSLLLFGKSPLLNYPGNKEHIRFFNFEDILKMTRGELTISKRIGLGSLLFREWNFQLEFPTPRILQVFANNFAPNLALGNLVVFKK